MSLSRRGFFRGVFVAGAAAALAPVVKLVCAPLAMKVRQQGITTAAFQFGFTGWKELPNDPRYAVCDMAAPITIQTLQEAYARTKFSHGPHPLFFGGGKILAPFIYSDSEKES